MGSESALPAKKINVKPAAASSPITQPEHPAQLLVNRTPTALLALQRTAGNRAVQRLLKRGAPAIQRAIQLNTGTPEQPQIENLTPDTAYQRLAPHQNTYAAQLNWSGIAPQYVDAILRGIDAENLPPMTLDELHGKVLAKAIMFNDLFNGQRGFEWGNSQNDVKVRFMNMIREVYAKSAIMRQLLTDIHGMEQLRSIVNELANDHVGRNLVDSFVEDTINMGDLEFFPETPGGETPWQQTRGEHLVHVLAERYFHNARQVEHADEFRFPRNIKGDKPRRFGRAHAYASEQHNRYRQEQGQPKELLDEGEHTREKSALFVYEGEKAQKIKLGPSDRPLSNKFYSNE